MKKLLSILVVLVFVAGMTMIPSIGMAKTWQLRLSHVLAPTSDYQIMGARFAELMEKKTNGQVKISLHPSGQLGNERVAFEQLQMGAQDLAISGTPVLSAWVPEGQVFDLPYLV